MVHACFTKESIESLLKSPFWICNMTVDKKVKNLARIYFGGRGHYGDLIMLAEKTFIKVKG